MIDAVEDLDELFARLRPLMDRHASALAVVSDVPGDFQVQIKRPSPSGSHMWFGAVQTRGDHVSISVMPVTSHPELLAGLSDELRARMQGRACFDFTPQTASPELIEELTALIDRGLACYRRDKLA